MFNFCTPKEEYVSCDTCKCLLKKENAQNIPVQNKIFGPDFIMNYCNSHKVKFESAAVDYDGKMRMYSTFEVSEDGTPVGYKKIDNKK